MHITNAVKQSKFNILNHLKKCHGLYEFNVLLRRLFEGGMPLSSCILENQVHAKEGKSLQSTTFDSNCLISNERGALFWSVYNR